ncbi:DUF5658 family protein [bacterium]|nr:DUF5658 family protein [bacterium]
MKSRIIPVNAAILFVGMADLITTLFWFATGRATEVNPIMAIVLQAGIVFFVLVKIATLGAYVIVMEWYRRHRNPVFAGVVGRLTLCAYISIYAVSFYAVNHTYFIR